MRACCKPEYDWAAPVANTEQGFTYNLLRTRSLLLNPIKRFYLTNLENMLSGKITLKNDLTYLIYDLRYSVLYLPCLHRNIQINPLYRIRKRIK